MTWTPDPKSHTSCLINTLTALPGGEKQQQQHCTLTFKLQQNSDTNLQHTQRHLAHTHDTSKKTTHQQ